MRHFFRNGVTVLILILTTIATVFYFTIENVTYKGKVMQHFVTANRYGEPHYITLASFEDGQIRSIEGIKYYVVPVGGTVYYETVSLKK